ncbi:MAG: LysM peptidoglycan-binding domain-containing protein [Betaproteobacteria bacterium]|nr:MAG: LysM peptidoglycan-binding domain-containing protein [Betaproteobacteria bacterium]
MTPRARAPAVAFVAMLLFGGCMTRPAAPVIERTPLPPISAAQTPGPTMPAPARNDLRPQTYTVKSGDTLAKIALDNGLDYRELASWNGIDNPNVIRVGQVLMLGPPGAGAAAASGGVVTAPLATTAPIVPAGSEPKPSPPPSVATGTASTTPSGRNTPSFKTEPKMIKLPYSEQAVAQLQAIPVAPTVASPPAPPVIAAATPSLPARPDSAHVPEIDDDKIQWVWPAAGKVVAGFSETSNFKGIDIAGKSGQPVVASAAGRVVYAGNGLRGYGKLVIIKHNNTYLTAYAHNREILVKEKQEVAKGQKISEMGDTDADQVKLHFEIRRLGKPVDPTKYLPPVS